MADQLKRDRVRVTVKETWTRLSHIEVLDSSDTSASALLTSPASTFRTPSLTASDEEEIEKLEQWTKTTDTASPFSQSSLADSQTSPRVLPEIDWSQHLSQLGDSTSLFSPNTSVENSPEVFNQIKEARIEPQQPSLTSENPFRKSRLHQNTLQARQKRGKMVVEREPPKSATVSPRKQNQPIHEKDKMEKINPASFSHQIQDRSPLENIQKPEFGMVSPLQNRLQSSVFNIPARQSNGNELQSSVFNIPKPQQPRVEHHRSTALGYPHLQAKDQPQAFRNPYQSIQPAQPKNDTKFEHSADFYEIPRPANHPTWAMPRPVQPTFSSFVPVNVNTNSTIGNFIDLTSTVNQFHSNQAIHDDFFGAGDPYEYVDIGKATENIKALLEGAFDDEEDKPKTRARKKKAEAAISGLVEKMQSAVLETETNTEQSKEQDKEQLKEEHHEEEDEEDDDDDGTIEGLKIKLLPHQVDGVEWMRDKEIGTKKKNGVLPKGGILADDVRWLTDIRDIADCMIDGSRENDTVHLPNTYKSSTHSFSQWCR